VKGLSIENLMRKLSIIPGLSFLERWVTEFRGVQTSINQRVGDLDAYKNAAVGGVSDVAGAVRGQDAAAAGGSASRSSHEDEERSQRDYGYEDSQRDDYEEEDYGWEDY
jgi:hypothetical protein